jgi:hypothetical protein
MKETLKMLRKLLIILLLSISSSVYAQNCKLSGVDFSDLSSEQTSVLISAGAQCISPNKSAVLPDFNKNNMTNLCTEKWSKRGVLDQNMFNYCMNRKTDSYGDLNYLLGQSGDIPGLGDILQYGINEWNEDEGWDMVLYEVKQQIEGYLDVEYLMSTGTSASSLQDCKQQWLDDDEPQWVMVRYCLENK